MKPRVLVCEDDQVQRDVICAILAKAGYDVGSAPSGKDAVESLRDEPYDLLLTDMRMPGMDGLELLRQARRLRPELEVVVMTAYATVQTAVAAMKEGAVDYLAKPFDKEELLVVAGKAIEQADLRKQNQQLRELVTDSVSLGNIIGEGPAMQRVFNIVRKAVNVTSTVLIQGESGTGKELVARHIHFAGPRKNKPFTVTNCAAIPDTLVESELFGHEKGAFTGADASRPGKFELANEGTLFLDEIGDMRLESQAKLLRVLQEKEYERVGSSVVRNMDVRVIVTTNRDLSKEVAAGRFRQDLYYRLNVFPIHVPPLCERPEDIPGLARHFLRQLARESGREAPEITGEAMHLLAGYNWPGNVRELKNVMERAFIMGFGDKIEKGHIEGWLAGEKAETSGPVLRPGMTIQDAEEILIRMTLERYGGHREKTAQALGISVRTLINRLREWKLENSEANVA